jgi:hypothetical protein
VIDFPGKLTAKVRKAVENLMANLHGVPVPVPNRLNVLNNTKEDGIAASNISLR